MHTIRCFGLQWSEKSRDATGKQDSKLSIESSQQKSYDVASKLMEHSQTSAVFVTTSGTVQRCMPT